MTGAGGAVALKPAGNKNWKNVSGTRPLFEGDALRVGQGGRATLYQPGCPPRVLKEGEALVASAGKRWLAGDGARPITLAQYGSLLRLFDSAARSARSQPTLVRPVTPEAEIARSPRAELVLDGRPAFLWNVDEPDSRSELELYQGDRLVWEAKTDQHELAYPADRPALKPGGYQWQVYVTTPLGKQVADGAPFTVPAAAAAEKIRSDVGAAQALLPAAGGVNLPLISAYVTHRLYTPAEAALRQALSAAPDDAALRLLLAHVYSLMGRNQARAELLKKASPGTP
jgi:hypothetical protein